MPRLVEDGVFGPKTQARVIEFQKQNGLVADGIVGPKTWAVLDPPEPRRKPVVCGNGDPANLGRVESIRQQFISSFRGIPAGAQSSSSSPGTRLGFGGAPVAGLPSLGSFNPLAGFKPFAGSPLDTAKVRSRYGSSIDFSTVFISDKAGLQGRPFTVAFRLPVPIPGLPAVVQVMNLGPSPSDDTVIHEMAHVWQSQHHPDPVAFMKNCVSCQATALGQNGLAAKADPSLVRRTTAGFPVNFPFSAYAYRKGNLFGSYGGEQIAEQIENNEAPIVARVRSVAAGTVDAENVRSLTNNLATEDLRLSGILI